MMLGNPEPVIPKLLRPLRQPYRRPQRLHRSATLVDRALVQETEEVGHSQ